MYSPRDVMIRVPAAEFAARLREFAAHSERLPATPAKTAMMEFALWVADHRVEADARPEPAY